MYKELNETGTCKYRNKTPNKEEVKSFWSNLWSNEKCHNTKAKWLNEIHHSYSQSQEQQEMIFTKDTVMKMAKKIKNWKAPGKDEVHGYWIKHLTSLHERLAVQLQHVFLNEVPD